jgi:transcriptional regulator GlxA family with amidase domain
MIVSSRLDRIGNWGQLAREAAYKPAIMAALAPVSLRQLERYFIVRFGKTPRRWAQELQCQAARDLIQKGYSSKATAGTLGFRNQAEFCRIFKKVYRLSPQHFSPVYRDKAGQDNLTRHIRRDQSAIAKML